MADRTQDAWTYVIIWEFRVRAGMEERFEQAYGANGEWAHFFLRDEAYLGTDLIRDLRFERTYLTLDFWRTREAYEHFRARHGAEYQEIDHKCEQMTESEREIGSYSRVGGEQAL